MFAIGFRICEEVLNVPNCFLPYVHCFVCLLWVSFVDNSYVVYYFLQFLMKKKKQQLGLEFWNFYFFYNVFSSMCVL